MFNRYRLSIIAILTIIFSGVLFGQYFTPVYIEEELSDQPYLSMNIYITSAVLNDLDLETGDEIGIFDGEACVGAAVLNSGIITEVDYLSMIASSQDPEWPAGSGFTVGNNISYHFYDSSQELEISTVQTTYLQGEGIFSNSGTVSVELVGLQTIEQSIALTNGWNIVSFNMSPDDMDMFSILSDLIDEGSLVKVQNEAGAAIEYLSFGGGSWANNIGNMEVTEGYYLKVNSATELTAIGEPVELPLDILLTNGWNIMSYPAQNPGDAFLALESLIDEGTLVKVQNEAGAAIEYLSFGGGSWANNIGNFESGEGYYIKVNQETTLTIDEADGGLARVEENGLIPSKYVPAFEGNPYMAMNLYVFDVEIDRFPIGFDSEIGIFDNGICVGSTVFSGSADINGPNLLSIPVGMDDPTTEGIDGYTSDNSIEVRFWDGNEEYVLDSDLVFTQQGTGFITFSISELVPDKFVLYNNYPNPFNPSTTINYSIAIFSAVNISIYSINGGLIQTLVNSPQQPGQYAVQWNASNFPSGLYFVKLISEDKVAEQKVLLIK